MVAGATGLPATSRIERKRSFGKGVPKRSLGTRGGTERSAAFYRGALTDRRFRLLLAPRWSAHDRVGKLFSGARFSIMSAAQSRAPGPGKEYDEMTQLFERCADSLPAGDRRQGAMSF